MDGDMVWQPCCSVDQHALIALACHTCRMLTGRLPSTSTMTGPLGRKR